jgi:hypothetical protein
MILLRMGAANEAAIDENLKDNEVSVSEII